MATTPLFFALILWFWLYHGYKRQSNQNKHSTIAKEETKSEEFGSEDEVLPVHFVDQAAIMRTSIINYTFRYNKVLEAEKLHNALLQLVQMPGWRKLGGRLRATKNGRLEIHVPRNFSRARPAVRFSHLDDSTMSIDSHPLASQLPKPTGTLPSVQEGCHAFRTFALPSDLPNNIEHYLNNDEPLLCLRVTSFADATLVGFTFPHSFADVMGTSELVEAWSNMVAGRGHLVKPLEGTQNDVLDTVGTKHDRKSTAGEFLLERQQTRGLSFLSFMARYLWDVTTRPSIQARHVYLPANYMTHLRRVVEQELKTINNGVVPFVSDGDLITAWGSRMVMSSNSWRNCGAVICNVFDLRGRLEKVFIPGAAYLQNLILPSTTVLSREEATAATTAQIALRLRQAIVEQTSDEQTRRLMRLAREWFAHPGTMPLFANWNSRVVACTNWTRARLMDAANLGLPTSGDGGGISVGGTASEETRPVMYWGTTLSVTDNPRDTFIVYGKDAAGNYWLHAYLRQETWDLIVADLEEFRRQSG
ncbi:putative lysr family regulatory protein [Colletotrichum karsti]|uniref:Lysr family regulatory protein n=1 Tax=Colletotrichum karsti TaxID=1095194 RepID=A0A9P6HYP2_9PEZI|nr:putative lysr family regulatory protein [Colletotrichum karsti]KAF9873288.1 putative lysr family regulatory protein [Colletotrichum karsti]